VKLSSRIALLAGLAGAVVLVIPGVALAKVERAWIEVGPGGARTVRAITTDSGCPKLKTRNKKGGTKYKARMVVRVGPSADFPVTSCSLPLPTAAIEAKVKHRKLGLGNLNPKRIVVIGDTGCRLKAGHVAQACNDPAQWPFKALAHAAAKQKPDLVMHLGDILYREAPCPVGNAGCANSPYGYNWETNKADFFKPAKKLLHAAPWLMVRGDHESCSRNGVAWNAFFDTGAYQPTCQDYAAPYTVPLGDQTLMVMDSSDAVGDKLKNKAIAAIQAQLAALAGNTSNGAWLATHGPFWGAGIDDTPYTMSPNLAAAQASLPANISFILSGHMHLYELNNWVGPRPGQAIIGSSGTALIQDPGNITGMQFSGDAISSSLHAATFAFAVLERHRTHWTMTLRSESGAKLAKCKMKGTSFDC
jgi:hypothetical protein